MTNANNALTPFQIHELQAAAQVVGQPLLVVSVGTEDEVDQAFTTMAERNVGAILYGATLFFQVISPANAASAKSSAAPGSRRSGAKFPVKCELPHIGAPKK